MKKKLFCFLPTFLFIFFTNMQTVMAQTNTATGSLALASITTGTANTATGAGAMFSTTTGSYNSAHGFGSLFGNISGNNNSAFGTRALFQNTTGSRNTATGDSALFSNLSGSANTAVGSDALRNNFQSNNSALGAKALFKNTNGTLNTATGWEALRENTGGSDNTANGASALQANTTGNVNTAIGGAALASNTTGSFNTASGGGAMVFNTTGINNTANGYRALYLNTTGNDNTASGYRSLYTNSTGFANTASGFEILYNNTTGYGLTAMGYQALIANTTGIGNIGLGYRAGASSNDNFICTFIGALTDATANVTNSTALGFNAVVTASNQVRIGNTEVTSIGGQVNWTVFSDGRFKNNLNEDVPGLEFITKLRPVTYNLDVSAIEGKLNANRSQLSDKGTINLKQNAGGDQKANKTKIKYTGFVAQEVEEVAKKLDYEFSGIDKPKSKEDFYGLRYSDFVVPLVKAVQELSAENKELKETLEIQIREQQLQIIELKEMLSKLMNKNSNTTTVNISGAYLKQNVPNPHRGSTTIFYHLPPNSGPAKINIINAKGQVLKSIAVNGPGDGQIIVNAAALPSGTYNYSLWIDGMQVDSKKMLIVK